MSLNMLVLADPKASWLKLMENLDGVSKVVINHEEQIHDAAARAEVILNGSFGPRLLATAVPLAKNLKWMHSLWTGVDNVLSPEVIASEVPLTNGRGVFKGPLAEWAVGAMLHFAYDMRRMIRQQEAGKWEAFTIEELRGKYLGVIGYGEIGRATAERAAAFGMRILATRRRSRLMHSDSLVARGYPLSEINALMRESDYVLVAAPLTPETKGLVGAEQIAAMKPSAVIINVGRGAVIDEDALAKALAAGSIKGAALDVYSVEPLPAGHAFYNLPNVLLSPHTADHVQDFVHLAVDCFLDNLRRYRAGEPLTNIVDKHAGY